MNFGLHFGDQNNLKGAETVSIIGPRGYDSEKKQTWKGAFGYVFCRYVGSSAFVRDPKATVRDPKATFLDPKATVREPKATVRVREPKATVREPEATVREPEATVREPALTYASLH